MFVTSGSRGGPGVYSVKWQHRPPITRVRLVNGQVITQNVVTTVSWDQIVQDDLLILGTTATPITTFKAPLLYNRVKFQWHTIWAANNSGLRKSFIVQNGSQLYDDAVQQGSSFNDVSRVQSSRWFDTAPGDLWSLQVTSDQVNLTFSPAGAGSQQAWLQAEWGAV